MSTTTTNFSFTLPAVGGDDDAWGTQLNSNWSSLDTILNGGGTDIVIDGTTQDGLTLTSVAALGLAGKVSQTVYTMATSGTVNIDPENGTIQTCAVSGDITFTESLANGESVLLRITSVGADDITWPAMEWMFGQAPVLDTTNTNWVQIFQVAGTVYGLYVGYSA